MHDAQRKLALISRLESIEARFRDHGKRAIGEIRHIAGRAAACDCFSLGLVATYDLSIEEALRALRALERGAQEAASDLELLQADLDEGRVAPDQEAAA